MKSFLNFLKQNKLYTFIEVVGMAIALAFVIFIATFVTSQLTRDNEVKGRNVYVSRSERLFIGCGTIKEQLDGRFSEVQSICRMFDTEIFGGIEMSMRYTTTTGHSSTSNDDRADALVVDENFFQILPYPLLEGTHESVLATTQSVVISESFARIFSPNESPMGKTIEIYVEGNTAALTVSGVFRDITNSVIRSPKIIYRIDQLQQLTDQVIQNGSGAVATFFQLVPNADVAALSKEMEKIVREQDYIYKYGVFHDFYLIPFEDIQYSDLSAPLPFINLVNHDFFSLFFAAGLLLLIFAVLNYISLTVAQIGFRAREMATRRLVGAQRWQIVLKYILESFSLTAVSFGLALLLAHFVAPSFSELIGQTVAPFEHITWGVILMMMVLVLLLSILSGVIPALMVLKYQPIDVVRGSFEKDNRMVLGRILIIVQNIVAIITLAVAVVMFVQLHHMQSKPQGYERQNRLRISGANTPADYLVEELKQLACVEKVGWVQFEPFTFGTSGIGLMFGGQEFKLDMYYGDQTAFDILGFEVIRQNAEPIEPAAWLPESLITPLGVDYDCTMLHQDNGYGIPICGIIKDFQKGMPGFAPSSDWPVVPWIMNMDDPADFRILRQLIVQVSGDENEAVKQIAEFYRQHDSDEEISVNTYNYLVSHMYDKQNNNAKLIMLFTLLTLLLSSLAMLAMSTYYAKQHTRNTAIHKVMGCENRTIYFRTVRTFLSSILIAAVIAVPCAWLIAQRWLETYDYRIVNAAWYYIITALAVMLLAVMAISWQAIRLMNTNPVEALKSK